MNILGWLLVPKDGTYKELPQKMFSTKIGFSTVNNAGAGTFSPLETMSLETARDTMEVNFFGVLRAIKAVLPALKKQGSGHLINISSQFGIVGEPFCAVYSASKFAVEGLSESLAPELKHFGIK